MNTKFLFLATALICIMLLSCSEDNNEPYGPEFEVDGIELSLNHDYYYQNRGDTISANQFVINLKLMSDNKYAQDYGINPKISSEVVDIKIFVLGEGMHIDIAKNTDVSQFFLVDESEHYYNNDLYQTIAQYSKAGALKSSGASLYFTNQIELAPKSEALITDTISLSFRLDLTLKNNKTFSDQLHVTLIP